MVARWQLALESARLLPHRRRQGIPLLDLLRSTRSLVFTRTFWVDVMQYAELQVSSNFSFLQGASHPRELVNAAIEHRHYAIALTDRNTLSGIVLAHSTLKKAQEQYTRFIVGCRLDLTNGESLLCYP